MTTTTHETLISVDDDVPQVRTVREFDAPPVQVFRAHADPDLFAQWTGPRYLQTHIDRHDGRTRLTSTSLTNTFEGLREFVASGMEQGVRESYEQLDEPLAS